MDSIKGTRTMPTVKSPFNPWDIKDPETDILNQVQQKAIADQQNMLKVQQMNIGNSAGPDVQQNLAPLLGLVDQWTGSNFRKAYAAPESGQQKLDKVQALEAGLAKNQNVLTDNQLNQLKAHIAEKKEARDTQLKYLMHRESLQNAWDISHDKLDGKKGKPIAPTQLAELGALAEQPKALDKISQDWEDLASAPGSGVRSLVQNQPANVYEANRLLAGTGFGKAMLGNARSHEMLMTHVKMLPSAWEDKFKKDDKITTAKRAVVDKYNEKLKAFADGGYDVSQLKPLKYEDVGAGDGQAPSGGPVTKTYQGKTYTLKPGQDSSVKENWVVE